MAQKNVIRYFLILILSTGFHYANAYDSLRIALDYYQSSQYQKALPIFIDLSIKYKGKSDIPNYALCQLKIADIIRNFGGANVALELLTDNEKLMSISFEKPTILLAQNHLAKGEAFYINSKLSEFKKSISKSIEVKKRIQLPEKYLAEDYLHLARYYKEVAGQNDSCYYWAMKSLKLAKADRSLSAYLLPRIYNLIGYYFHPASFGEFLNQRDLFYERLKISRRFYDSAFQSIDHQSIKDELMLGRIYQNLGNSYNNQYQADSKRETMSMAMNFYKKSTRISEQFGSPSDLSMKDWVIGKGYERLYLNDSAILQFQKGISRLIPGFNERDIKTLPPLQPTLNDARFISLVTIKANNFYLKFTKTQNTTDLLSAYQHYEYLIKFNHYLISKKLEEQDVIQWSYLYGSNAYQRLIVSAYELFQVTGDKSYLTKSYGLLTSAKYAWLNKNDLSPRVENSIKESVLNEEIKLVRNNILSKIPTLSEAKLSYILPATTKNIASYSLSQITLVNQVLGTLSIESMQHQLGKENGVLLDFYIWNKYLYKVIISDDVFDVIKQKLPNDFNSRVWKMRKGLLSNRPIEYAQLANSIYKETLDSVLLKIPKKLDHLIICPDDNLQGIPWDALVVDTLSVKTFKGLNYLINRFAVRTVLTPRHLLSRQQKADGFYGVASDFTNSKRFSSIPFSTSLVRKMASEYNGTVSNMLLEDSLHVGVFHIASHVVNDSLRPYRSTIYFNDLDSVTIDDLSKSLIHPRLAILNGCQTGNGTYYQSEGTISFARAFYRMGAESVLMTLWSVDDKTTADLLESFYKQMEDASPLDISLREAKVYFIKNALSDELANPYYWAGLQLSGKAEPIYETDYSWIIFTVVSFITLSFFAVYSVKKKKLGFLVKRV